MGKKMVLRSGKKIAPPVSNKPRRRFNFIKQTFVNTRGLRIEALTLSPADMEYLNQIDSDSDGSSDVIPYPKFGFGTQPSNPASAGDVPSKEQKELLCRSIANLLRKNGLSVSANVLMLEAEIKEDSGATPPDFEGFLLEFLKKGESNAEKLHWRC